FAVQLSFGMQVVVGTPEIFEPNPVGSVRPFSARKQRGRERKQRRGSHSGRDSAVHDNPSGT
ncbi:MAG: hypothetical protein WBW74_14810, partial [Xanthobacteraceae bacterium]